MGLSQAFDRHIETKRDWDEWLKDKSIEYYKVTERYQQYEKAGIHLQQIKINEDILRIGYYSACNCMFDDCGREHFNGVFYKQLSTNRFAWG